MKSGKSKIVLIDENLLVGEALKSYLERFVSRSIRLMRCVNDLDDDLYDTVFLCRRDLTNIEQSLIEPRRSDLT